MIVIRRFVLAFGVAVGLMVRTAVWAAESQLGAHLGLDLIHSDNVGLTSTDSAQSDTAARPVAGINFNRSQSRFESSVAYEVEGFFYKDTEDSNSTFHSLDASGTLELLTERWFFDVYGVYDQTLIAPENDFAFNNFGSAGNLTDVGVVGASSTLQLGFGANARGALVASYSQLNYDDPSIIDTAERFVDFELGNGDARAGGAWAVRYNQEEYDYDILAIELLTFEVDLGYWIGRAKLFTTQGLENDYAEQIASGSLESGGLDAHYWYVGVDWVPDDRSNVSVAIGERQFGDAKRFRWERRLRAGSLSFSYNEEPATFLREQLSSIRITGELAPIDALDGPAGNRLYLQERYDLAFFIDRPKSGMGFRFFDESRFDLVDQTTGTGEQEETEAYRGTEASFEWRYNERASLSASLQIARREYTLNDIDDRLQYATISWGRQWGRQGTLSVSVQRQTAEPESASDIGQEYEQNNITVGIQRWFGAPPTGGASRRVSGYAGGAR
jgi:hypothetical protein